MNDRTAVLINAWEPHAYAHDPTRPRTIILALYIEPGWLRLFRPNWAASGAPGFFERSTGDLSPRVQTLKHDLALAMVNAPEAGAKHEALLAELMIAVIERFTPWQTLSASLRTLAGHGVVDGRIPVRSPICRHSLDPRVFQGRSSSGPLSRRSGRRRASS